MAQDSLLESYWFDLLKADPIDPVDHTDLRLNISSTANNLWQDNKSLSIAECPLSLIRSRGRELELKVVKSSTSLGETRLVFSKLGVHLLSFAIESYEYPGEKELRERAACANWTDLGRLTQGDFMQLLEAELKARPLMPLGTRFQLAVWRLLLTLPRGAICHYGDIATGLGSKRYARAVGQAVGKNPIALFIPCHRVLATDNKIGNFRWDSWRKASLLQAEQPLVLSVSDVEQESITVNG